MLSELNVRITPLPKLIFGVGSSKSLAKSVQSLRKDKVLIVTDQGLVEAGLIEPIVKNLKDAGLEVVVFDGVDPNPTVKNVEGGVKAWRKLGDPAIIAIGGGSPIDASKAIALVAPNEGPVLDFQFGCKPPNAAAPIIAVPTTAGTGSETNMFALITDPEAGKKVYIAHPGVQPHTAVLDPALTLGLPKLATAACGFDVLTHAMEALVAQNSNPYTDGVALEAIHLVNENLMSAWEDGADIEARSQMLLASSMAAIAFNTAGLGAAHGTGHPISARFNTTHGQTLAVMLPHVMEFNMEAAGTKYARAALYLGHPGDVGTTGDRGIAAVHSVRSLRDALGLARSLADIDVGEDSIDQLAQDALADFTTRTNPRKVTAEDAAAIYRAAL